MLIVQSSLFRPIRASGDMSSGASGGAVLSGMVLSGTVSSAASRGGSGVVAPRSATPRPAAMLGRRRLGRLRAARSQEVAGIGPAWAVGRLGWRSGRRGRRVGAVSVASRGRGPPASRVLGRRGPRAPPRTDAGLEPSRYRGASDGRGPQASRTRAPRPRSSRPSGRAQRPGRRGSRAPSGGNGFGRCWRRSRRRRAGTASGGAASSVALRSAVSRAAALGNSVRRRGLGRLRLRIARPRP